MDSRGKQQGFNPAHLWDGTKSVALWLGAGCMDNWQAVLKVLRTLREVGVERVQCNEEWSQHTGKLYHLMADGFGEMLEEARQRAGELPS